MRRILYCLFSLILTVNFGCAIASSENAVSVPILVYHNFNPTVPGEMTITPARFQEQLNWLKQHGYTVIPLMQLVQALRGKTDSVPPKSVVITDDDGNKAVFTYMLPIVQNEHIPVTLFIYPQIISRARYALTWEQLKTLQHTGLFDVQGHTYWHPNFKQEKKRLSEVNFEKLVYTQLVTSKKLIEKKLGTPVTLLAWPFGIHNRYLEQQAEKAGYVMSFSIAARHTNRFETAMAQPRYMIIASQSMRMFESIVRGRAQGSRKTALK